MKPIRTGGLAALLVLAAIRTAVAASSLCSRDEAVIFACPVGAKLISVCASPGISPSQGYLAYRFGPPQKPEISYQNREMTRSGTWSFSGGGGAWLRFTRGPISYIAYTAIGRGWGTKAGVAVLQDGKLLANLPCRAAPDSEIGPDFFAHAGIADDDQAFDLP